MIKVCKMQVDVYMSSPIDNDGQDGGHSLEDTVHGDAAMSLTRFDLKLQDIIKKIIPSLSMGMISRSWKRSFSTFSSLTAGGASMKSPQGSFQQGKSEAAGSILMISFSSFLSNLLYFA